MLIRALEEIQAQRARPHQRLAVIVVRDGDNVGVVGRKREVDEALRAASLPARGPSERIVLLVPTWSVESWLLRLLEEPNVDEQQRPPAGGATWKQRFENQFHSRESEAARNAARA